LGGDGALPYDFLLRLENHDWPGNIRELHNAVARQLALGDLAQGPLSARAGTASPSLPAGLPPRAPEGSGDDVIARVIDLGLPLSRSREIVVDDFERRYVQAVLDRHQGDATRAAQASGIARRYFQLLRARQSGKSGV
jgi:two-component system response regulator HydG